MVDFAYAVHTDVGNHCTAARVNHELAPLRTELKNGDLVEIITAAHANPNPAWLAYIKTGRSQQDSPLPAHHAERGIGLPGRAPFEPGIAGPGRRGQHGS